MEELLRLNDLEEFKSLKKPVKVENTDYTYRRFHQGNIEILAYAGGEWSWSDTKT